MRSTPAILPLFVLALETACGSSPSEVTPPGADAATDGGEPSPDAGGPLDSGAAPPGTKDAGATADSATPGDAASEAAASGDAAPCDGGTCIQHVVIIVQENHTFDVDFGAYCTAAAGSNPTCTDGPACCEAIPSKEPGGTAPSVVTDAVHGSFDPNHTQSCELSEIDLGKMDGYVTTGGGCGDARNVATVDRSIIQPYWDLAAAGALADRYFQPIAGASSSNDMYLARASYVFTDNDATPAGAVGLTCQGETPGTTYTDMTIGDLLDAASVPWAWFAEGYDAMAAAGNSCPNVPADCPYAQAAYPCVFDPSDIPFEYYPTTRDVAKTMKDYSVLQAAIASGSGLPAVSFVKAIGYRSEHPGSGSLLSAGVNWASALVNSILGSAYGPQTLVLLTYDEGGGYFDHVAPPPASAVDGKPYGTRLPLIAAGPFARKNSVSHMTMEHSSIVKFIEWNWLGGKTGQLGTRDAVVNNLGSLIDPGAAGIAVPEN